jgi:perosamine synthetase
MIKLAQPYIPQAAIDEVCGVLRSGDLVQGTYVSRMEAALRDYLQVKHALVVSSGTAALHLSLMALGIAPGDEVIVPAFTFPATANVVELLGAKPVFVDITLEDYCIDPSRIDNAITPRTRAIMPVHEFGQPSDLDALCATAGKYNLPIVEDAACALGAEFHNKKVGRFGAFGCFSFHPRKTITTGEGGAVVTDQDELADRIRALRNHGIVVQNGKPEFVYAGLNYRMTDFQAALGLSQLSEIENLIDGRIRIAAGYDEHLSGLPHLKTPARFAHRKAVYQTYHLLINGAMDRDEVIRSLRAAGIESNFGAHALNCLPYYRQKYGYRQEDFPNAVQAFRGGLAVPMGHHLRQDQVDWISDQIKSCWARKA